MTIERTAQVKFEEQTTHQGFTIAQLRQVLKAVQNKDGWKLPWAASVSGQLVKAVLVAVEFYHADRAEIIGIESLTGNDLMRGNGYQA